MQMKSHFTETKISDGLLEAAGDFLKSENLKVAVKADEQLDEAVGTNVSAVTQAVKKASVDIRKSITAARKTIQAKADALTLDMRASVKDVPEVLVVYNSFPERGHPSELGNFQITQGSSPKLIVRFDVVFLYSDSDVGSDIAKMIDTKGATFWNFNAHGMPFNIPRSMSKQFKNQAVSYGSITYEFTVPV